MSDSAESVFFLVHPKLNSQLIRHLHAVSLQVSNTAMSVVSTVYPNDNDLYTAQHLMVAKKKRRKLKVNSMC